MENKPRFNFRILSDEELNSINPDRLEEWAKRQEVYKKNQRKRAKDDVKKIKKQQKFITMSAELEAEVLEYEAGPIFELVTDPKERKQFARASKGIGIKETLRENINPIKSPQPNKGGKIWTIFQSLVAKSKNWFRSTILRKKS